MMNNREIPPEPWALMKTKIQSHGFFIALIIT